MSRAFGQSQPVQARQVHGSHLRRHARRGDVLDETAGSSQELHHVERTLSDAHPAASARRNATGRYPPNSAQDQSRRALRPTKTGVRPPLLPHLSQRPQKGLGHPLEIPGSRGEDQGSHSAAQELLPARDPRQIGGRLRMWLAAAVSGPCGTY